MNFRNVFSTVCLSAACIFTPVALSAATSAERLDIHQVDLRSLVASPGNYDGMRVQFRAIFVERGDLFDPFHTRFREEEYLNVIVWDDQSHIWTPEIRANAVSGLYYRKTREHTEVVAGLKKYQPIDVIGYVVSSYGGEPWVDVHSITVVEKSGAHSDASVFLLQQGASLAEEGVHDLADQNFASALVIPLADDARVSALEMRALNLLSWGKFAQAVQVVDEALEIHRRWTGDVLPTKLSQLHYLAAKGYSELAAESQIRGDSEKSARGDFQKSIDNAQLSVTLDPDNGDAFAILGIGLSGLEKYDEARVHCQRAILMRPSNATIRWYLGRILDRQGEYEEAISVLNRAIDLSPKDYRIHKTIALVYLHRSENGGPKANQDRVTALREFDIAIRLNALDADLFYYSGLVIENAAGIKQKVRIGKAFTLATMKLAADRYHKCIDADDSYLPAVLKLATYYRGIKKHDEAVAFFKRALELAPEKEELYADLGNYFTTLGKLEDAYVVYAAYQKRQPKHLDTLYALARLSLDRATAESDVEKKATLFKHGIAWGVTLVKIESQHAMGHADLSEMYVETGAWKNAIKHADAALAVLADDAQKTRVYRKKGIAHWALDDADATIAALATHSEGSTDMRVLSALAWALSTQPAKAAETLAAAQRAVALNAQDAGAQELLGWGQYLGGDFAAAEKTLTAINGLSKELRGYRLGMAIYKQGSERFAEAQKLLDVGSALRNKRRTLRNSSKEISTALRAIRGYNKNVQRQQSLDARKAAADKKAAAATAKKAALAQAKKDAANKKAAAAKIQKAATLKAQAEAASKKAAEDKMKRDAAVKKAAAAKAKKVAAAQAKAQARADAQAKRDAKVQAKKDAAAKKAAIKKAKEAAARKKAAIEKVKRAAAKRKVAEEKAKNKR